MSNLMSAVPGPKANSNSYLTLSNGQIVFAVKLREAATMAAVSYKKAWRDVRNGVLGAVRRGGVYIVPIPALLAYVSLQGGGACA